MPRWKPTVLATLGATVLVTATLSTIPLFADEARSVSVNAAADTTVTMVWQDGDGRARTTLASCPRICAGNQNGERDPFLEFAVSGLPADATAITATLQVSAWQPFAAQVSAHAASGGARSTGDWGARPAIGSTLDTRASVVKGANSWNVSAAVRGNGTYTFALLQRTYNERVYWASMENTNTALRPKLLITYKTGGTPAPSPTSASPSPTAPSPRPTSASPSPSATSPSPGQPSPSPTATQPSPTPTATNPPGWRLKWSDEFTSSTMDTSKWNARNARVDYDKACITNRPQNLQFANGVAILRAQRENYTCGPETRQYTVAYMDTIGKQSWTYGRFEIRAKSPNGPTNSTGLWPAFWLRPNDGGNGEIDVTELPGGSRYYQRSTAAIFRDYTPTKQDIGINFATGTYPGDGFHTYVTEWEANEMRWYIDGKLVWTRSPQTTPWYTECFNKPYNIRLNFQVGGWLGDPDANTQFPAEFQVDYVRVYQR